MKQSKFKQKNDVVIADSSSKNDGNAIITGIIQRNPLIS